ncbi:MAG: 50S ribosomal protein L1 [Buchnera aphidicola (Eriosoma harunire)]
MKKITKRMQLIHKKINKTQLYSIDHALQLLIKTSSVKFIESVDLAINLGIDPKKSEQNIKSTVVLPHGIGRMIKIAVFTQGKNAEIAKKLGATVVGMDDLVENIKKNGIDFNLAIASLDAIDTVSKLGSILGPRGLMPNSKLGTLTNDIETAIKNAQYGQIFLKNDKNGVLHTTIGKINFTLSHLIDNFHACLEKIKKLKPSQSKGIFIKKITLSTTMGSSISLTVN